MLCKGDPWVYVSWNKFRYFLHWSYEVIAKICIFALCWPPSRYSGIYCISGRIALWNQSLCDQTKLSSHTVLLLWSTPTDMPACVNMTSVWEFNQKDTERKDLEAELYLIVRRMKKLQSRLTHCFALLELVNELNNCFQGTWKNFLRQSS